MIEVLAIALGAWVVVSVALGLVLGALLRRNRIELEAERPVGWSGTVETPAGRASYHAHGDREPSLETKAAVEELTRAAIAKLDEERDR